MRKRPFSGVWTGALSTEIKETRIVFCDSMLTYRREGERSPLDAVRWSWTKEENLIERSEGAFPL
jgi:hypothetical protein